jgi:uroporphyrinogen-III decarboxylase
MNSRERFLTVINGEIPDRVPVAYFIVDQGHFLSQVYPGVDRDDYLELQMRIIEVSREIGGDILLRVCYGINPMYVQYGGMNVYRDPASYSFDEGSPNYVEEGKEDVFMKTDNWEVHSTIRKRGKSVVRRSRVRTPDGDLTQEFTITEIGPKTCVYACTEKPVKTERDLDVLIKYEPGMEPDYPQKARTIIGALKEALGDDGILSTWTPHGPFNIASLLIPDSVLYSLFLADYPFYEKLMNYCIERTRDYTNALSDAGVDAHSIGANVAGGFLGKANFDQYILPFEKRYIKIVQSKGIPAIYHNCGQIKDLVESYIEVGPRIVEPFSPPPLGDADLSDAKRRSQGKFVIIGNVDQVNVLQPGPIDKIKAVTRDTVNTGKAGGKFILHTADFLEYGTPIEHVKAFVETGIEYGVY